MFTRDLFSATKNILLPAAIGLTMTACSPYYPQYSNPYAPNVGYNVSYMNGGSYGGSYGSVPYFGGSGGYNAFGTGQVYGRGTAPSSSGTFYFLGHPHSSTWNNGGHSIFGGGGHGFRLFKLEPDFLCPNLSTQKVVLSGCNGKMALG